MILTKTEGVKSLEKFILETSVKHRNIGLKVKLNNFNINHGIGFIIFPVLLRRCISFVLR